MSVLSELRQKFRVVWPHLDERTRRLTVANEALSMGYGGVALAHRASGLSRKAIAKGIREIRAKTALMPGRIRRPGAGRKPLTVSDPRLLPALEALIEGDTRGDPESPLRWTSKSTRTIAAELRRHRHPVSHVKVAQLLHALDYSLQGTRKTEEGADHPERDAQFRYINAAVKTYLAHGWPVISVDTKKKELVGPFHNGGRRWRPAKQPVHVLTHDFPGPDVPRAYPYGIYDIGRNTGFVNIGMDHDTAAFAVASIRGWWRAEGPSALSDRDADPDHRRRRREQRRPVTVVEAGAAEVCGYHGAVDCGVSFPTRDQQMEQGRTPAVLVHLVELAGRTVAGLRDDRPSHRQDDHGEGVAGHMPSGPAEISLRTQS